MDSEDWWEDFWTLVDQSSATCPSIYKDWWEEKTKNEHQTY